MTVANLTNCAAVRAVANALSGAGLHDGAMDLMLGKLWNRHCDDPTSLYEGITGLLAKADFSPETAADIARSVILIAHYRDYPVGADMRR